MLALKLVIPKDEYHLLISDIEHIFDNYKNSFKVKSFEEIIQIAGFKTDWKSILDI